MVDSSVCRAAIHTGVLTNEGGLLEFVKGPKTKIYEASEDRGVVSNKYDEYALSFTVTKAINLHIELSESFKNRKLIFTKDQQSFLQEKIIFRHRKPSFLQVKQAEVWPEPIFKWNSDPNLIFDGLTTTLPTKNLANVNILRKKQVKWSVVTKVRLEEQKQKELTIVSHSNCGGWALVVNEKGEIVFKKRCFETQFSSYYRIPYETYVNIAITYDDEHKARFYINTELVNTDKVEFDFDTKDNLDIGCYSSAKSQYWDGRIVFIQIFDQNIGLNQIKHLAKTGDHLPNIISNTKTFFTIDKRQCVEPPQMNPIPGHPDAPLPPAKATTMHYQGIIPEAQIPVEDVDFATIPLTCDHSIRIFQIIVGAEHFLTGPSGHTYRVKCPESCLEFNKQT